MASERKIRDPRKMGKEERCCRVRGGEKTGIEKPGLLNHPAR